MTSQVLGLGLAGHGLGLEDLLDSITAKHVTIQYVETRV